MNNIKFEINTLSEKEKKVLCCFSLLSPIEIEFDELKNIFFINEDDEINFYDLLHKLTKNNWIINSGKTFRICTNTQNYVIDKLKPSLQCCSNMIDYFMTKLQSDFGEDDNNIKIYALHSESILEKMSHHPRKISSMANNLLVINNMNRNFEKAVKFGKLAIKIIKKHDNIHYDLAFYYTNMAIIHQNMGDFNNALMYSKKDINVCKQLPFISKYSIINSYNVISTTYKELNNYEKSIEYRLKAIKMAESVSHPKLGHYYQKISTVYYNKMDFKNAKLYISMAVDFFKETKTNTDIIKYYTFDKTVYNTLYIAEKILSNYGVKILIAIAIIIIFILVYIFLLQ